MIDSLPTKLTLAKLRIANDLEELWQAQADYNAKVKALQPELKEWGATYLLGLVGEVGELLTEIRWKRHRRNSGEINRENLGSELADLTKYVLCLWQEYGFTAEDMLSQTLLKTQELAERMEHEFFPPSGHRVIISDLDGTGADYRAGFCRDMGLTDNCHSLQVDVDLGIPLDKYSALKHQFEAGGGYAKLPFYEDWRNLMLTEKEAGTFLVVFTARPYDTYNRIRNDTRSWLNELGIFPDILTFGREERVMELLRLTKDNQVILLEDDPTLAFRAAVSGFTVWLREQPYNTETFHPNILHWKKFPAHIDWEALHPNPNILPEFEGRFI